MTKFVYIYSIQFIYIIRQIYYIYQHLNNRTFKLYGSCAPTNFVRWKFNISKSTGYICRIKWAVSTLHWIAWLDSASVQYVLCRHGLECWGGGQYILKLPDTDWSVEVEGNISWSYLTRTGVLRWRAIYPDATWYERRTKWKEGKEKENEILHALITKITKKMLTSILASINLRKCKIPHFNLT